MEVALCARQLRVGIDTRAPLPRRRSVTNTLRASSGFGGDTQLLQVYLPDKLTTLMCWCSCALIGLMGPHPCASRWGLELGSCCCGGGYNICDLKLGAAVKMMSSKQLAAQ